jgi:hypothetical protein
MSTLTSNLGVIVVEMEGITKMRTLILMDILEQIGV